MGKGLEVPSNREIRSALVKHLFHQHGELTMEPGNGMTLEALEQVHKAFHLDDYACPPHTHKHDIVQEVKLTYGEDYVKGVMSNAKQYAKDS